MRIDANLYEVMRGLTGAYHIDRSDRRTLNRLAVKEPDRIESVELPDGERLFNVGDVVHWLIDLGREKTAGMIGSKPPVFIHAEMWMTVGPAAAKAKVNRNTLADAIDKRTLPFVTLAFGTPLVSVIEVKLWHRNYFTKQYKMGGVSRSISGWALATNIPASVLFERLVKNRMTTVDAIAAGGVRGGRRK